MLEVNTQVNAQVKRHKHRSWMVLLTLLLVVVLAACGSGTSAATEATVALAPTEAPAATATEEPTAASEPTEASAEEANAEATEVPAEEAAEEPAAEATAAPAEEAAGATGSATFVIDAAQSEVRFTLDEILMGNPTTVVGTGNGIEGTITVNFDDYSQSAIRPIIIDASLLATDNNMRNGQIRRAILQTNNPEFQFITFTPTAVEGFPESATVGEPFTLSVTGDLTIRTVTQPMTFEVEVTPMAETEIHGSARATLLRENFDLQIPSVPSVAGVSEEVLLEFDFVALAQ